MKACGFPGESCSATDQVQSFTSTSGVVTVGATNVSFIALAAVSTVDGATFFSVSTVITVFSGVLGVPTSMPESIGTVVGASADGLDVSSPLKVFPTPNIAANPNPAINTALPFRVR